MDALDEDKDFLKQKLLAILEACDDFDDMAIEDIISELKTKKWSKETNDLIGVMAEQLLLSGFDEIKEAIEGFLG